MSISDTVKKMASTVADKAVAAGNAVVDVAQTAASSAVNVVEKVTGRDLNGDGSIGEKAADVAAAEVEVSKDAKTD